MKSAFLRLMRTTALALGMASVLSTTAMAASNPLDPSWRHGPFMEVYVRAYQDSNGDGVGDLKGLTSRLDYLCDLGVRGIWLMPIFASQDGDHGYAVKDYRAIESDYGSLADFDQMLKAAHERGIGVILDYTLNHSAQDHPFFLDAERRRDSPYRDWYVFADRKPAGWDIYGKDPWHDSDQGAYFAAFSNQMPEFNLRNPAVVDWHLENLRFWLDRGVDGFRFDAVGNLFENGPLAWEGQPENHTLMKRVRAFVDQYPSRKVVCEAPGDPLAFASTDSCGGSFAFGLQHKIVTAALGSPGALEHIADYFTQAGADMATFANNHDSFAGQRLWDRTRGDEAAYRMAAATYLLLPGTPFLYYGEEIGLAGARSLRGDHRLRTPMSWTADPQTAGFTTAEPFRALSANGLTHNVAAQSKDASSLLAFYKTLIALRQSRGSLLQGAYADPKVADWVLSFDRVATSGEKTRVFINYHSQASTLPLDAETRVAKVLFSSKKLPKRKGRDTWTLPPQSVHVLDLSPAR